MNPFRVQFCIPDEANNDHIHAIVIDRYANNLGSPYFISDHVVYVVLQKSKTLGLGCERAPL